MERLTKDIKNEPGIYEILNIKNNKRYIGQSQKVRARLQKHRRLLIKNEHQNSHLQNAFNKYGIDSFSFNIIEYCSIEELDFKENFYIKSYKSNNPYNGYNYRIDNRTNRGLKWSDEQREKMKAAIENNPWYKNHTVPLEIAEKAWEVTRNKVWTEEERKRHSEILKGTKVADTTKMKLAQTGENNGCAKLKENDVKEIFYLLHKNITQKIISEIFNISSSNVYMINKNKSWKFIDRNQAILDENVIKNAESKLKDYERQIKINRI